MFIKIVCPTCHQVASLPSATKGTVVPCPLCQAVFQVPRIVTPPEDYTSGPVRSDLSIPAFPYRAMFAGVAVGFVLGVLLVGIGGYTLYGPQTQTPDWDGGNSVGHLARGHNSHAARRLADKWLRDGPTGDWVNRAPEFPARPLRIGSNPHRRDPVENLADLVGLVEPSIVQVNTQGKRHTSTGSGFVLDVRGIVVTSYHVVDGADAVQVTFQDNRVIPVAGYLNADPTKDLVLLKIEAPAESLSPLHLCPDSPRKGEWAATFGNPLGLAFSMSQGIISGVRTAEEMSQTKLHLDVRWIQTTAPVSPGNSGGPLVNMRGEVIGVNTAASGELAQNVNFAVSADDVRDVLRNATLVARPIPRMGHD